MTNISTYEMLDVIFNNIDHVLCVSNTDAEDFKILYINDTYETLGIGKELLDTDPNLFFESRIYPDDKKMLIRSFTSSIRKNEAIEFDFRVVKPGEEICWLYGKFIPVLGQEGIVNRVVCVAADVSERKKEEQRLTNLYKVQGDVMKMLAHDLRTPISGVKIMAESIMLNSNNNQLSNDHLSRIIGNCDETLMLMEDLLSYIQTDNEYIQLNLSDLIVEQSINLVVESFAAKISEKQITIMTPNTQTKFSLDSLRFNQILANVISNAVKFSNRNSTINVYLESTEKDLIVNISDQGIGIPDDMLSVIFDVFTTSRRLGTSGEKSTGLGLSITKRLVELHGGSIQLISKEFEGTIVQLTFPNIDN